MIEPAVASYEQNELIHKIRSTYGTKSRTSKGVSTTSELLQDGIRSDTSRSDSVSDDSSSTSRGNEGIERGAEANERTTEGSHSRARRANSETHEGDGGTNS